MSVLRIYFSAQWRDASSPCLWALCDLAGEVIQSGESSLSSMPAAGECVAILSADRVLMFTAPQPPGSRRRWQAALPFIAEERVMVDPDDIHVVAVAVKASGMMSLAIVDKSWLKLIVAATAGLNLRRMVAESLLPELAPDSWTLVWDGQSGFLRTSATTAVSLDAGSSESVPVVLVLSLRNAAKPPRQIEVRFPVGRPDHLCTMPQWDMPLVAGEGWDWRKVSIPADVPNLLSGEFAPPVKMLDWLPRLRPVLPVLLVLLAIEVVGVNVQWAMLANEKNSLKQQMDQSFRTAFGNDFALVDPVLQMQRKLAGLRHQAGVTDSSDFIPLLDAVAGALAELGSKNIRSMSYETGKLDVEIQVADISVIDALKQKLYSAGFLVRTGDMHYQGNIIQTRLTLSVRGVK